MWVDSFTVGSNFFQNFVEKEAGTGKVKVRSTEADKYAETLTKPKNK